MPAPTFAELLERNEKYSGTHTPSRLIGSADGNSNLPKTCVVTCADPRVHPETFLNLKQGEAVVFRTIAGHPQDALNGIITLDAWFGGLDEIALVHHTNCGTTLYTDDEIRGLLADSIPAEKESLQKMKFGAVSTSIEDNVREDVAWMKRQPLMRPGLAAAVKGYVYDVTDGKVRPVS